jgi:FMN phosphatase YigB (HAD superfamily)
MSNEKIKITIISDLVKIDNYRSHINKPDNSFLQEIYGDQSIDDLKRIHDIYTRYLLDYRKLGEPYPAVIESLEYNNEDVNMRLEKHKDK